MESTTVDLLDDYDPKESGAVNLKSASYKDKDFAGYVHWRVAVEQNWRAISTETLPLDPRMFAQDCLFPATGYKGEGSYYLIVLDREFIFFKLAYLIKQLGITDEGLEAFLDEVTETFINLEEAARQAKIQSEIKKIAELLGIDDPEEIAKLSPDVLRHRLTKGK